jgi:hypothetical protein
MHVGGTRAKMWFGVLICKGKSTSISAHEHLTFMKHIYIDVNDVVIVMRLSFMLKELVGATEVGPSSYSSQIYFMF